MTTTHNSQIINDPFPYYYCTSYCIEKTGLFSLEQIRTKHFQFNKAKVEQKLKTLTSIYCVGICAYSIANNHYQFVARIEQNLVNNLSDRDVAIRWSLDHALPPLINDWLNSCVTQNERQKEVKQVITLWRERLINLGWFMKELNQYILDQTDLDGCKVNLSYEYKYTKQRLKNNYALLVFSAYTDLISIYTGIYKHPEQPLYTSIYDRIKVHRKTNSISCCLVPFLPTSTIITTNTLPCTLSEYLYLIHWSYTRNRFNQVFVLKEIPNVLKRLHISPVSWLTAISSSTNAREITIDDNTNT